MGESAELTLSQQEAEAHLQRSRHAIHELQAALRNAQVDPTSVTSQLLAICTAFLWFMHLFSLQPCMTL